MTKTIRELQIDLAHFEHMKAYFADRNINARSQTDRYYAGIHLGNFTRQIEATIAKIKEMEMAAAKAA